MERTGSARGRKATAAGQKDTMAGPRIAVMGVGNLLLSDEGIGIHVIQEVEKYLDPARVQIIDAGTVPDIFSLVGPSIQKLIIIDAADGGGEPGSIYTLSGDDIACASSAPVSLHDIGLAENLRMMKELNPGLLSVSIIGVQAGSIEFGLEPTAAVRQRMPELIQMVLGEIRNKDKFAEVNT